MIRFLLILFLFTSTFFTQSTSVINYTESDEIFFNPERGFYADAYSHLTTSFINSLKAQNISVVHRIYNIGQFRTSPLSDDFLNLVSSDLSVARNNGVKVAMRFYYTDEQNGEDAALDTILMHISQLEPVFRENEDVIAFIDAGFIGAWGEWYYSSHGLNNTEDRRTVLFSLLSALPTSVDVVIRTPNYKRLIFNYDQPLTPDSAFSSSFRSRTGAHNDCFLADATDMGTYQWDDIEGDKDYLNADNRFVPQSGETCQLSEYCECSNALTDLARMHWSTLNSDYNTDVLGYWENQGCMPEIKRRLGYRFVLRQAEISDSVKPNGTFVLNFDIDNVGFANPYKARGCEVILRDETTGAKYKLVTDVDPRFWYSGDTTHVEITGGIPVDMPEGNYSAFLFLPDTAQSLHDRKDYAIRLANENVWEDSTGYNSLLHSVVISSNASGETYTGDNYFVQFTGGINPPPPGSEIIIDGDFEDWSNVLQLDTGADAEQSGDALNGSTDLLDMWTTNNESELFVSYSLSGTFSGSYFYHVFFDTDNNPATGFHSGGSYGGFDYMVENENLYVYAGSNGEWAWNYIGAVTTAYSSDNKRCEMALEFSDLNISAGSEIGLVFNINNNNPNVDDDYAPNSYTEHSYQYQITVSDVETNNQEQPDKFEITAYPNPFNGIVTIGLKGFKAENTRVRIFDVLGRLIKTFSVNEIFDNGKIRWFAKNDNNQSVNSGVYFVVADNGVKTVSKKIIYLK